MKTIYKILIIAFIVLVILFFAAYMFIANKGKSLVINYFHKLTARQIDFDKVYLGTPLNLRVDNLKIKDLIDIENVIIYPDIPKILAGNIAFSTIRLVKPVLTVIRNADDTFNIIPNNKGEKDTAKSSDEAKEEVVTPYADESSNTGKEEFKEMRTIALEKLTIENGVLNFIDKKINKDGFVITLNNVDITLARLHFPPFKSNFKLQAQGPGSTGLKGLINSEGWIDLKTKNMSMDFNVKNLDGVYLSEYIKRYLDTDLISADLNLSFHAEAVDNVLNGKGKLVIENFDVEKREKVIENGKVKSGFFASAILGGLNHSDKKIELDLELAESPLDNPAQWKPKRLFGSIAKPVIEEAITHPQETIEKIKEIGEKFEGVGKELEGVFKKEESVAQPQEPEAPVEQQKPSEPAQATEPVQQPQEQPVGSKQEQPKTIETPEEAIPAQTESVAP